MSRRPASKALTNSGRRPRDIRGFTIIEVALAPFVMAFGIATSTIAMQAGFRALDVARDSSLASQIMQGEIERLRLMAWSNTGTVAVSTALVELPVSEASACRAPRRSTARSSQTKSNAP